MHSINRFLYGPTPEEKVRAWQTKLRSESRQLDREMRQVGILRSFYAFQSLTAPTAGYRDQQSSHVCKATCYEGRCKVGTNISTGSRSQ